MKTTPPIVYDECERIKVICSLFSLVFIHVQTTQTRGGSAVLRTVCRGSAGSGGLVVPCGAPAG